VKLAHRDPKQEICVYTDASEAHWAAVVTQSSKEDVMKPIEEQNHSPLAFVSAAFKDTESRWTMFEKEGYPIYQVFKKMDYLFITEENVRLYTDHRNLLFVFSPLSFEPSLGRHAVSKVLRWALYLSRFSYVIEHVAGEKNIFADMISRWYKGYRGKLSAVKRLTHVLLEKDIVDSPMNESFVWPSTEMVVHAQKEFLAEKPNNCNLTADNTGTLKIGSRTWIPNAASDIKWKLLVVAHCGTAGHRGILATFS